MITSFQDDPQLVDHAAQLCPGVDAAVVLARVAWSLMLEPGDSVAGALIEHLGAIDALEVATGSETPYAGEDEVGRSGRAALRDARRRWRPRLEQSAVRIALRSAIAVKARLSLPESADWPVQLGDLGAHAPQALWWRSAADCLPEQQPRVAIVGARASSSYGDYVTAEFAAELASDGVNIVSGGAYGIDGAAHRAALGVQGPTTAFLAGGVDRAYPVGHQQLLQRIAAEGVVLSELPCGAAPTKWRFLSRNRLIAAYADATVVVEAGWRSGSLNTAGHAASLGRPLGAVPGPVTSATSAGTHRLLREYDAVCVTTSSDVKELLGIQLAEHPAELHDPRRSRVLDALSRTAPRSVGELAKATGITSDELQAVLGMLTLEGAVSRNDSEWIRAR